MAHYAFLDNNNIVTEVIVGVEEDFDSKNWEQFYTEIRNQKCLRTSYNTRGGIYYNSSDGQPSADQSKSFRKNYAGIGYTYDSNRDAFIPPKPHSSWVLNEETCLWESQVPRPEDGKQYVWNEEILNWQLINEVNAQS